MTYWIAASIRESRLLWRHTIDHWIHLNTRQHSTKQKRLKTKVFESYKWMPNTIQNWSWSTASQTPLSLVEPTNLHCQTIPALPTLTKT